jgi:hypothetical protein
MQSSYFISLGSFHADDADWADFRGFFLGKALKDQERPRQKQIPRPKDGLVTTKRNDDKKK